ncbi:MAG: erythromycin esterase family protein [Phycisphaeraceae bacterium]|nr:erythromycin esterase family protein [Phycisphaeraceae bacterium]
MHQWTKICLWGILVAVVPCGCTESIPSDHGAFEAWVSDRALPIKSLETSFSGKEIESLREMVGAARVVGLGESRHDTREQLLLKGLLTRHLIEDQGFRALIIEESFSHAARLDQYVTSGKGDPRALMNRLAGWYLWDTEEMLELVQWIRQFNEDREPGQKVHIFGMDITAPALGVQDVMNALADAGVKTHLDAQSLGLDLQRGDFWPTTWERYAALSDDRKKELAENYDALTTLVKVEKTRLMAFSSRQAYERMARLAEIGKQGNAMFSSASREEGGAIRERGMAQAVLWILDQAMAGSHAIVWSHNLHVARSTFRMPGLAEGTLTPMGAHLSDSLGDAYLAIGGTFGTGSYGADLPPGARMFEAVPEDVLDGALSQVGMTNFLVDRCAAASHSKAAQWLQKDREMRAQDTRVWLVPGKAFDWLYFVKEITRAQPTPLALRRFQSLGTQH